MIETICPECNENWFKNPVITEHNADVSSALKIWVSDDKKNIDVTIEDVVEWLPTRDDYYFDLECGYCGQLIKGNFKTMEELVNYLKNGDESSK